MKKSNTGEKCNMRIRMKEEVMEEIDTFGCLGIDFIANERMDAELSHRNMEVRKCAGVWKNSNVSKLSIET